MSTYRLDKLFSPRSVAVVGASPRDTSPGRAVLRNLRAAGFEGSVSLVNPRYGEIEGIKAVNSPPSKRCWRIGRTTPSWS
jgi:acetyltransferase